PHPHAPPVHTRTRRTSAREVVTGALERIERRDRILNCFTGVLGEMAIADADRVDRIVATGGDPGPLAGVPFAVKNLFDVAGVTTVAGSRIHAERPPATRDATAVAALRRAGAVLVGCLNMDEDAFGLTTEDTHYGPTRNPHDRSRLVGRLGRGSCGRPGAAEPRLGHERLDSRPGGAVRRVRAQADVRARVAFRRRPLCRQSRSRRAPRALGSRPRPRVRRGPG